MQVFPPTPNYFLSFYWVILLVNYTVCGIIKSVPTSKRIDKLFFKNWSRDMAYVLGFFLADGNMIMTKRGGYFLSFYSADKKILYEIRRSLNSDHKISKRPKDNSFRMQIGSKEIFNDLERLSIYPNKSKRMKAPVVPLAFAPDFIRGYFDGDGNVWMGTRSGGSSSLLLQTAFTSASKGFLEDFLILLKKVGIEKASIGSVKNKNCSRLRLSIEASLKLHYIMYNMPHRLFLNRKKLVFEKFIKMRV